MEMPHKFHNSDNPVTDSGMIHNGREFVASDHLLCGPREILDDKFMLVEVASVEPLFPSRSAPILTMPPGGIMSEYNLQEKELLKIPCF